MIELGIVAGHGFRSQTTGMFASRHQIFLEEFSKRKGQESPEGFLSVKPRRRLRGGRIALVVDPGDRNNHRRGSNDSVRPRTMTSVSLEKGRSMLTVRDPVKIYPGPVAALQSVDLDIPHGMFGLLGSNGAGKTTLMRILAGLLEPTAGKAALDGESILDRPETIWGRLGYLPQDFGFFPHLTGDAQVPSAAQGGDLAGRPECALQRAPGASESHLRGAPQGQALLGRHAAAPGNRAGHRRRSPADHRGRAHGRPRP